MHLTLRLAAVVAGVLAAGSANAFSITVKPNVAAYQDTLVPASGRVDPTAASSTTFSSATFDPGTNSSIACVSGSTANCIKYAPAGSVVVLEWTNGANTEFAGWSGCSSATGTTCTVSVSGDRVVTASFRPATYEVRAKTSPARTMTWDPTYGGTLQYAAGGIDCRTSYTGSDCSGSSPRGAPAVLTALPLPGSRVKSWSGCTASAPNATTCTLTAYQPSPVAVAFEADPQGPQLVTLQVVGAGKVTAGTSGQASYMSCQAEQPGLRGNDCSAFVDHAGEIVLTAIPPLGGKLAAWSGCTTSSALTCTVSDVTEAKAVTALFKTAVASTDLRVALHLDTPATNPGAAAGLTATATSTSADPVECTATFASKPAASAALLTAATGDCKAGIALSFVPDVEGAYEVRVTPAASGGIGTSATLAVNVQWYGGGAVGATEATPGAELTAIATRLKAVLAKGYNTISADVLMKDLLSNSTWQPTAKYGASPTAPAPGPFTIVDVRDPEDFARGHIPGAINVPLAQIPAVLLGNPALINGNAATHKVAVAGYNGGDANMASFLINVSRSDATGTAAKPSYALFGGMTAWSYDRELSPTRFDDDLNVRRIENGPIETAAQTATVHDYTSIGAFDASVADDVQKKILVRARAFLQSLEAEAAASGIPHREAFWTTWVRYNALKSDGNPANDPQVIDVRSTAAYARHVPGAIFIAYQQVAGSAAVLDQTKYVDPTKKVFVYCVTGHTGGIATMALGVMGYQARNVLWAINGWSADSAVVGTSLQDFDKTRAFDFPLDHWQNAPSTLVAWDPPRAGCQACHSSHAAQFVELLPNPLSAPTVTTESTGEG